MVMFGLLLGVLGLQASVAQAQQQPGYGQLVGEFRSFAHGITGTVYAASEDTIFIKGFSYDGQGPDAFFWIGYETQQPSPQGILLPYPDDGSEVDKVLQGYNNADIVLRLPAGLKIQNMKWLSVWCRRFTVDFGNVMVRQGLIPPRTRKLEQFSRLAHKVQSGEIVILNTRTFYIPNFHYDGAGPDAFFWVGNGSEPSPAGVKVPDERGSYEVLRGYMGQDIEITLPEGLTVYDIEWLSVWCVQYRHNFGWVRIPRDLSNLPPYLPQARRQDQGQAPAGGSGTGVASQLTNCRPFVNGKLQVRWGSDSRHAYVQLAGEVQENEWMAFGLSGSNQRAKMEGGDVVVTFYDAADGTYRADDYLLTAKSQCSGRNGVCPDTELGSSSDAMVISGQRKNGVTTIAYKRPLATGDSRSDKSIPPYGDVQVIAAIGTLNPRKQANYHSGGQDSGVVDFSAVNRNECGALGGDPVVEYVNTQPWPERSVSGVNRFTAQIGPTGGRRGYEAITGFPSWGIAWWINDMLIPELYVRRGETYTFTVEGGNDPSNPAEYHPLYITSDPEGGYASKNATWRAKEQVFAGVSDAFGGAAPTAAGRLCEYSHRTTDQKDKVASFEEYRETLERTCAPGRAASLEWTVDQLTPDTVYYQCYTHRNLGWKIHVLDAGAVVPSGRGDGAILRAAVALLVAALSALVLSC